MISKDRRRLEEEGRFIANYRQDILKSFILLKSIYFIKGD